MQLRINDGVLTTTQLVEQTRHYTLQDDTGFFIIESITPEQAERLGNNEWVYNGIFIGTIEEALQAAKQHEENLNSDVFDFEFQVRARRVDFNTAALKAVSTDTNNQLFADPNLVETPYE